MVIGDNPAFGIIGARSFHVRVENHIRDVEAGEARRSANVAVELEARHLETSDFLAQSHPESLSNYLGLLSGLDYGERARVAASMSQFSRGLKAFEKLHAQKAYAAQDKSGK